MKAERSRRGRAAGLTEPGEVAELKRVLQEIQSRLLPSASAPRPLPRSRSLLRKDVNTAVADTPRLYSTPEDLTDADGPGSNFLETPCLVHRRWAWAARASPPVRFACRPIEGLVKLKHPVYNDAAVTVSG